MKQTRARFSLRRIGAIGPVLGVLILSIATGCADTDREIYVAGESGVATFTNTSKTTVYLPGCAPFTTQQSVEGVWVDQGPPFVCFWEGFAVPVGASESVETPFQAPTNSGRYRVRYAVSAFCQPDLPLSQAQCGIDRLKIDAEFDVERELCDASELGCQFQPAAPNVLCEDGEHFSGPASECTRDPVSGTCGYEFLTCP